MRRSIVLMATVFALTATACTSNDATPDSGVIVPTGGEGIFAQGVVEPFDSCNDFLDYVKSHAVELVGPYGLDGYGGGWYGWAFEEVAAELGDGGDDRVASATDAGSLKGGVDYSETNVQVAGVDEPDIVKTDGDRIFVVAQGQLHWIDVAGTPQIVASIPLDGWGQQLFLSGDSLLVLTSGSDVGISPAIDSRLAGDIAPQYYSPRTVLAEVDVSSPDSMEIVRTLTMDGSIVASRMIDGTVRAVVSSGPIGFNWVYPEGSGIRAEQDAIEKNKELIEESTIENWVPWFVLEDHTNRTTSDAALLGCDQVGHPDEFSGLSMLSVLSIDLDTGLEPGNGIGLLAEGQTVYSSANSLYVATAPWMAWTSLQRESSSQDRFKTQIHAFDITDPTTTLYAGSGEVDGVLHSQWSMDEYEGTLRVVVTDENPWWGSNDVPETSVITMQLLGNNLVQVGSVSGLGKNESVYAVRFIEDKGYVVTFRQVDPLYVVDLSDPRDPTVEGELKINGYSAYLHPIGEDLLLGVGQDATDEGRTTGTQVSVFDVSDPADPRRVARLTFDEAYSDAEWDTHAFLWWPRDGISVLPLQRWSWDERTEKEDHFSGAVVISASNDRVKQIAEITHPSFEDPDCPDCWAWTAPLMRSIVIGDTLYTISETGILASDMADYEALSWLEF